MQPFLIAAFQIAPYCSWKCSGNFNFSSYSLFPNPWNLSRQQLWQSHGNIAFCSGQFELLAITRTMSPFALCGLLFALSCCAYSMVYIFSSSFSFCVHNPKSSSQNGMHVSSKPFSYASSKGFGTQKESRSRCTFADRKPRNRLQPICIL